MWAFQVALYRRDAEERARQEFQVKLDQVNLFLQVGKVCGVSSELMWEKTCACLLKSFKTEWNDKLSTS